nr:ORF1ab [Lopma virus]
MQDINQCLCHARQRVFWAAGHAYCSRCFAVRPPVPPEHQRVHLGRLGDYHTPESDLLSVAARVGVNPMCNPAGQCWLSAIYPVSFMTGGALSLPARVQAVSDVLYRAGAITAAHLRTLGVYDFGCRWYKYNGPVPGVCLYANSCHVSDVPFPGCTHVLTNLPLKTRPLPLGAAPFDRAQADTFVYRGKVVFLTDTTAMWTWDQSTPAGSFPILPTGLRPICDLLIADFPAHHAIPREYLNNSLLNTPTHFSFNNPPGRLNIRHGTCWSVLFEDALGTIADDEVRLAACFGYQLPTGVPGPYLMRRLHRNGLKLIVRPEGNDYVVSGLCGKSWIRHISRTGEPLPDNFRPLCSFSVMPFNIFTDCDSFRFSRRCRYGYSPPGDGNCGCYCLDAVYRDLSGDGLETKLALSAKSSREWMTDYDAQNLILTLRLPVTLGSCPSAGYRMSCVGGHWVVEKQSESTSALSFNCVIGVCGGDCLPVPQYPDLENHDVFQNQCTLCVPSNIIYNLGLEPNFLITIEQATKFEDELGHTIGELKHKATDALGPGGDAIIRQACDFVSRPQMLDTLNKFLVNYSPPQKRKKKKKHAQPAPSPGASGTGGSSDESVNTILWKGDSNEGADLQSYMYGVLRKICPQPGFAEECWDGWVSHVRAKEHNVASLVQTSLRVGIKIVSKNPVLSKYGVTPQQFADVIKAEVHNPRSFLYEDWKIEADMIRVAAGAPVQKPAETPYFDVNLGAAGNNGATAGETPRVTTSQSAPTVSDTTMKLVPTLTGRKLLDRFNDWVFAVFSQLPSFFLSLSQTRYSLRLGDLPFTLFCLTCLLLARFYLPLGFLPLVGAFSGSVWNLRLGIFTCWCSIAYMVYIVPDQQPGLLCATSKDDCLSALGYYTGRLASSLSGSVSVGILGTTLGVIAKLVGGSRGTWVIVFKLAVLLDWFVCGIAYLLHKRCHKCWRVCIRCAPNEVVLNTYPVTKISRSSLTTICDKYNQPQVDPIFISTGFHGCYTGSTPIAVDAQSSISPHNIQDQRISANTVVSPPTDVYQAVKVIKVLQCGGSMLRVTTPEVTKVNFVPYKAPFFPAVPVKADTIIVVDAITFATALRSGYSVSNLVVGTGDFAKVNNLKFGSERSGGGVVMHVAALIVYMCINCLVFKLITAPGSCGVGTTDPWCDDPFSLPVHGSGLVCNEFLCVSADGVAAPMALATLLSFKHWLTTIAILSSAIILCAKMSLLPDLVLACCCVATYTFPVAVPMLSVAPLLCVWYSLHPITMVWCVAFTASLSPTTAVCQACLLGFCWFLGTRTSVVGMVTPYDVHRFAMTPGGTAKLISAQPGTYADAVRRAALTGRVVLHLPNQCGSILEGCLRTSTIPKNCVQVVGGSVGSGGVFTIGGRIKVLTATHLLRNGTARVTSPGFSKVVGFECVGDFASADLPEWVGYAPKATFSKKRGKCYWRTATGVEPGLVAENFALCFTNCGDSGSVVTDEDGDIVGVHTGSNKKGAGVVTTPSGEIIGMGPIKLSVMSQYYSGPPVPVPGTLPQHVIPDCSDIPSDLACSLESCVAFEGGLSSVQLLCVFFLLWRLMAVPGIPIVAMAFFVLNEILPEKFVRSIFSCALSILSCFTPWSTHVLFIRCLTAALNRNVVSLLFFVCGGTLSVVSECLGLVPLYTLQPTYLFIPRHLVTAETTLPIIAFLVCIHFVSLILAYFGRTGMYYCLTGDGKFSKVFFMKYFMEGNLRDGVSESIGNNSEGLTASLAVNLSSDDLAFLRSISNLKCFVSASNMRDAANNYIETVYARALRRDLSSIVSDQQVQGIMAKLEAFVSETKITIKPGDIVVMLGRRPVGTRIVFKVDGKSYHGVVQETRSLAGTVFTVVCVSDAEPEETREEWGDDDADMYLSKKARRRKLASEKFGDRFKVQGVVDIDGTSYVKVYDTGTGNLCYYNKEEWDDGVGDYEGLISSDPLNQPPLTTTTKILQQLVIDGGQVLDHNPVTLRRRKGKTETVPATTYSFADKIFTIPDSEHTSLTVSDKCFEAARMTVEQAVGGMGQDIKLSDKELQKLRRIIEDLSKVANAQEALNLMCAAGLDRCSRHGLVELNDAFKVITFHHHTFSLGPVNLKVVDFDELAMTPAQHRHIVAEFTDGAVIIRPHRPTLLDIIFSGARLNRSIYCDWGPGNTDVTGYFWDFTNPPSKPEIEFSQQIALAALAREGHAPNIADYLPYKLHPVVGDPFREEGILKNTRFGDIPYKTPAETKEPAHVAACLHPKGLPVVDGKNVVGTTLPHGFELYLPTLPSPVLDYLDSRHDVPKMLTRHGSSNAATADLAKYSLSTQGFILPGIFKMVRRYLFKIIGPAPKKYNPSNFPAKNSRAGINGSRFPTQVVQSIPNIDEICDRAMREVWQTVTPVTLKKQYCSSRKTRTILGTNNLVALQLRSVLSGVTEAAMLKGHRTPIMLGKSKFERLSHNITGLCLECDLASCDRSTPAMVRWFTANLIFELACAPEALPLYVVNCCHDLISTPVGAVDKRGGLSSGDPITSFCNTIYSLIIYAQHMVLSAFRLGHPISKRYLDGMLTMDQLFELQPVMVYSDDMVLYRQHPEFVNYHWFCHHLELMLGFEVDKNKTIITDDPGFLGCRIIDGYLVPQRARVLAALAYHMKAIDAYDYFASASAILLDACSAIVFDEEWFVDLVLGMAECARKCGIRFPGPAFYSAMAHRLLGLEGKVESCAYCGSTANYHSACGLALCQYHTHCHPHCDVLFDCGHFVGSGLCQLCTNKPAHLNSVLDKILLGAPYQPPKPVLMEVSNSMTKSPPGRYSYRGGLITVRRDVAGNVASCNDGSYTVFKLSQECAGIVMPKVTENVHRSQFITGPPGSGKTHSLLSLLTANDVVYTPTHKSMLDLVGKLPCARFTPPKTSLYQFPKPSAAGPQIRLISSGYIPGSVHYVDEAAYANCVDLLKLLSHTPVVCFGDLCQLAPVGYDEPLSLLALMPGKQLTKIYRFGANICSAIQRCYRETLVTSQPLTGVTYLDEPKCYGQVLTPFHRDRVGGAITIDSSQGSTFDVVTLHLPTRDSLTRSRALVGCTRSRYWLFIYDPHKQLESFFNFPPCSPTHCVPFIHNGTLLMIKGGSVVPFAFGDLKWNDPEVSTAMREAGYEGAVSPLPQVCHNLGYYYSPDLPNFFPIPGELAAHWPVVTATNNSDWPNRLVVSLRRLSPHSKAMVGAGYHVGPSVFVGVPGVPSYYLTLYEYGVPKQLPNTLVSTGRIAADVRTYLSADEAAVAQTCGHAFSGDVKGTTVGGCHHITSPYLPRHIPKESIAVVGVSAPGKGAKAMCTLTDVDLTELKPYLNPDTLSKDYKVLLDYRPVRLMVWKDGTAYFHEGFSVLGDMSLFVDTSKKNVYVDPSLLPIRFHGVLSSKEDAHVIVSPDQFGSKVVISTTPPIQAPPNYKLIYARNFSVPGLGASFTRGYVYLSEPGDHLQYNLNFETEFCRGSHPCKFKGIFS